MINGASLRRISVVVVLFAFAFLWVREFTLRRAREAANDFVGPLIREVPSFYEFFSLAGIPAQDRSWIAPGWIVNFHPYGVEIDPGVEVLVSISGRVIGSNVPELNTLVGLSNEEREECIKRWIERKKSLPK
jgi:hypothetical protein